MLSETAVSNAYNPVIAPVLKVVANRPVPQDLGDGVVVVVIARVLQDVAIAACPDACLGFTAHFILVIGWLGPTLPHEDGLELVRAGIVEEQGWAVVCGHC